MSFLTPDDFTGKFAIAQGFPDEGAKLQEYIDYYEQKYLIELLGEELYTLFLAGYESDAIYEKIYDPFAFDSQWCHIKKVYISEGMLFMLKCFVYAHYRREDLGTPTTSGHIKITPEAGEHSGDFYASEFAIYNQGIRTYKAIRQWILENETDYPSYNGEEKGMSWLI